MTADIINLRQARKTLRRGQAEAEAAENRVLHGRTKAEKAAQKAESDRADRRIDEHRIEGLRDDDPA